jgi:microcystin-dependent protein
MTLWKWSKTAATNAAADTTINWAEGQPPSSINDSARAMMTATAKYRDDISGAIITTGTGAAYSVSTNQYFDTLAHLDGAMIAFTPHVTNTGAVTLNIDSLGSKPVRFAPAIDIPSNSLILGTPYVATYNNSDAVFYLQGGFLNPYAIPLAGGMDYWATSAPNSSFAFPIGQAISRTTYATLFTLVGTSFGSGDGTTTFNLPNKTERVSVMKASSSALLTPTYFGGNSTVIGATGGLESHVLTTSEMPQHSHGYSDPGHSHTQVYQGTASPGIQGGGGGYTIVGSLLSTSTGSSGVNITINNTGGGNAHSIVPPMIVCNYIMRVI